MKYKYLTKSDLIYINQAVLEFTGESQDALQYPQGLSIVSEQPKMVLFGHDLYPNIWLKAAFILQKITKKTSLLMVIREQLLSLQKSF